MKRTISLFVSAFFLLLSTTFCVAQTTINGAVSDAETGEPLIGASIQLENSSTGTTSDLDGQYTLTIPTNQSGELILIVSYTGHATLRQTVSANGTTQTVNLALSAGVFLNDVVVSARHRKENVQNVGQSIAAISGKLIESTGISDFSDLAALTPGLDVADRGPNRNEQAIRGIARVTPINDLILTPNLVANYLDEIPINSPGSNQRDLRLFDVNRVEVLRGPQGTLFGEGAVGGAIRTFTNDPNLNKESLRLQTTIAKTGDADKGDYRLNGMANFPIIKDKLGIRLVGQYRQDAGFIDNTFTNEKDVNNFQAISGQATLLWLPSDKIRIRASYLKDANDVGADWFVFSGDGREFADNTVSRPGPDERTDGMDLASLKADFEIGKFTISSISGYLIRDFDRTAFDAIQTNNVVRILLGPTMAGFEMDPSFLTADVVSQIRLRDENFSQEFRVLSDFDGPFNVTLGLFYKDSDFQQTFNATSDAFIPYNGSDLYNKAITQKLGTQISAYGELSYDITPKLKAIAGLRWFNEEQTDNELESGSGIDFTAYFTNVFLISQGLLPPDMLADNAFVVTLNNEETELATHSINTVLPKFALEFQAAENILLYASYSQGARIGGTNSQASVDDILILDASGQPDDAATTAAMEEALTFDEDKVSSYDLGFKSSFNDQLLFNAGIYYNQWDDIQTMLFAKSGFAYFENVGKAHTAGFELETVWNINDNFSFNGGLNYTQAEFDEEAVLRTVEVVNGIPQNLNPIQTIKKGDRIPNVPKYTYNFGLQASFPLANSQKGNSIFARFDYSGRGVTINRIEVQEEDGQIDAYGLANFRLGYMASKWSLIAFANNLFDKQLSLSFQRNLANPTESELYVNRPRQVGLTFNIGF